MHWVKGWVESTAASRPAACSQRCPTHSITHTSHVLREAVLAGLATGMGRFENTIFFLTTAVTSHRTCLSSPSESCGASDDEPGFRTCLCSTPRGFGRLTTLPSSR